MSSVKYEFRYMPLIGKLSGESMLQQTEQAINEIAKIVNENTAQADIINTLAQDANDNSVEALEKANEALETSSRVYIHETLAVNLDSYCESQLIYVANISSTNLPIAKKGFLEVKTDDDKTECVQLFVSDDKDVYVRSGSITAETVGDITVYTADFEEWTSLSSPTILLQAGNGTSIPLSADLNDYNTEGTFYCSTTNVGSIAHCPVSEGEFKLIVMKFATANYGLQMLYPIGKHLYVRKYSSGAWGNWEVIVPKITSGVTNGSIAVNDTDVPVTGWNTKADLDSPVFVGTPTAPTPANTDNSTKLATTEFVKTEVGNYLPLAGGTMSGDIRFSINRVIGSSVDNGTFSVHGGSAWNKGSYLELHGKDEPNLSGCFYLSAKNDNNTTALLGYPSGTLTWGGQNILTASNYNSYALPLSGGTLTGSITSSTNDIIKRDVDNSYLNISGGTGYDSARIALNGKGRSGNEGNFELWANNGVNGKSFIGKPDGTLTWGGSNVLTASNYSNYALPLSGGTVSGQINALDFKSTSGWGGLFKLDDTSRMTIVGGVDTQHGGALLLYGKDFSATSTPAGAFVLAASNGTNTKELMGIPSGELTWNSKEVERVNASGTNYIRYESGLQICWGSNNYTNAQTYTVTFPQPFISTPALSNNSNATNHNINAWCNSTQMTFTKQGTASTTVYYIAIGKWK